MRTRHVLVGLISLLANGVVLNGLAIAQPRAQVRPRPVDQPTSAAKDVMPPKNLQPLKKGVSKAAAEKLKAAADKRLEEYLKQELAADQAQFEKLRGTLAAEATAAEDALKADPEYVQLKGEREAILKKHHAVVAGLDLKRRQALSKRDQAALAEIQRAKIDEAATTVESIRALAQRYHSTFEKAATKGGLTEKRIEDVLAKARLFDAAYRVVDSVIVLDEVPEEEPAQPAGQTHAVFAPAFETGAQTSSGTLIATGSAEYSVSSGAVRTDSVATNAGSATHSAVVGSYITIPPGYSKVIVTVKVDYRYEVLAVAIGGGAWAESSLMMTVEGPGAGEVKSKRLKKVTAPIAWAASEEGSGTKNWDRTFAISRQGGEFLVLSGTRSSASGILSGIASAITTGTVKSITVQAIP